MLAARGLVAENEPAGTLLGDPLSGSGADDSRVFRWFLDPAAARTRYPPGTRGGMSRSYVADLRATSGRHPGDRRVDDFIKRLRSRSAEFATLCDAADVRVRRSGPHQVAHPAIGLIDLECTGMLSTDGRHRLVWYSPRPGTEAAQQLQLLTVVGSTRLSLPDEPF